MTRGGELTMVSDRSEKPKSWQCGGYLTPLIPSLGWQRQVDLQVGGRLGLHSEF